MPSRELSRRELRARNSHGTIPRRSGEDLPTFPVDLLAELVRTAKAAQAPYAPQLGNACTRRLGTRQQHTSSKHLITCNGCFREGTHKSETIKYMAVPMASIPMAVGKSSRPPSMLSQRTMTAARPQRRDCHSATTALQQLRSSTTDAVSTTAGAGAAGAAAAAGTRDRRRDGDEARRR